MMTELPWNIVTLYTLFGVFASQQKFCLRDLKDESPAFQLAIGYFAVATSIFGFGFLIYYGYKIAWWAPLILFGLVVIAMIPVDILEKFIPLKIWGLASFVAVPILGFLLIENFPEIK